ncbi:hypothetical protein [Kitasatospora sp. NPDC048407]|uniref:hypothetical protein n=1 Tax=Kitasatospora sp. NPDC048407 TaxID=3364051 RepID=UPI003715EB94
MGHSESTSWISLDSSGKAKSRGGPGGRTETLLVARNADGSGGRIELAVWRNDGGPVNREMLLRLAEKMPPTLDGWGPAGAASAPAVGLTRRYWR